MAALQRKSADVSCFCFATSKGHLGLVTRSIISSSTPQPAIFDVENSQPSHIDSITSESQHKDSTTLTSWRPYIVWPGLHHRTIFQVAGLSTATANAFSSSLPYTSLHTLSSPTSSSPPPSRLLVATPPQTTLPPSSPLVSFFSALHPPFGLLSPPETSQSVRSSTDKRVVDQSMGLLRWNQGVKQSSWLIATVGLDGSIMGDKGTGS
ncbi:unnamed protein product [Protopolystoma xenopodis]|uniref:Uncharacterized protein n=1 Tax=Protopolystoma xenopodis TaxID=117903 RepID=A0A448WI98_9PLAT|nr:unnamed protein product [Protopolystoma xenopodis]